MQVYLKQLQMMQNCYSNDQGSNESCDFRALRRGAQLVFTWCFMTTSHIAFPEIATALLLLTSFAVAGDNESHQNTILKIGRSIEALKVHYPQLKTFTVKDNVDTARLRITYDLNTHEPERHGGWTSGVPNPDADGIWFYIDIHDSDSTAQIHTQPVTQPMFLGDKRVSFLILEGKKTKSVSTAIRKILIDHGVTVK